MNARRLLFVAFLALLVFFTLGGDVALAQDAAEAPRQASLFDSLKHAGVVGIFIFLFSVAAMGISIERFLGLRRDNIVPPDVLAQLEQLLDDEEYEEAMTLCESQPSFLTNVIAAGLPKIGTGWDNIKDAMTEVGDFEATKLQQSISYINLIVNVSPLMGLLGTVLGMISAFQTIANSGGTPDTGKMAGNIQEALVTTCLGLIVAIPFSLVYFYFRNKVQRMVLEVAAIADELMDRFKE